MELEKLRTLEAQSIDGSGNNLTQTQFGAAGSVQPRLAPAAYGDGLGQLLNGPNPRAITNAVLDQDGNTQNSFGVNDLFSFFGQFLDHDMDLTPLGDSEIISSPIPGDETFFPEGYMFVTERSEPVAGTGTALGGERQYDNLITSFIDASNVYGSDPALTSLLRADGGTSAYLLLDEDGNLPTVGLLKTLYPGLDESAFGSPELSDTGGLLGDERFVAGDTRVNENIALTSLHTVWAREHNYHVEQLERANPGWTEDELFEAARAIVQAEMQVVVYNEYLPRLIGDNALEAYEGYDDTVDPGIALEFSTAAYRLGHSQVPSDLLLLNEDGDAPALTPLFTAFFNPDSFLGFGIEDILRGSTSKLGQELDAQIVDDVRNLLFGPGDLGVLNILRGRDHGIPTLNDVRGALRLDSYETFEDLTGETDVAARLASVYDSVDDVELWVGGLAEADVPGSQVGETFTEILRLQFEALRDGDRFFYETRLEDLPILRQQIEATTFAQIIARNTDIEKVHHDAFLAHERMIGSDDKEKMEGSDTAEMIRGGGDKDDMYGNGGDDTLYGEEGKDKLYGGDGNDWLEGGVGKDKMFGGDGDDVYVVEGKAKVSEKDGGGFDIVHTDGKFKAGFGIENIFMSGMDDAKLKGNDIANVLSGNEGDNKIKGDGGGDTIFGNDGDDKILGGAGGDIIDGGRGDDLLFGKNDADTFVFRSGDGNDEVRDFELGIDSLDVGGWFEDEAAFLAAASEVDGTLQVSADGTTVTFKGLELIDLDEIDLIF